MRIKPIIAWSFLLLAGGTHAAEMNDFYLVRLPASSAQLTDAQRSEALDDMLIRYSGLRELPTSPALQNAQQHAARYIAQTQARNENGDKTVDVSFDPTAVQGLAHSLQLPTWSPHRPTVMLWLLDNRTDSSTGERRIMLDQEYSAAREALRDVAMARGLPLLLPLGDLEDSVAVSTSDVYGNFIDPIAAASVRYQPDAVLVASLNNDSLTWDLYDAKPEQLQQTAVQTQKHTLPGTPEQTLSEMVEQVADHYAKKAHESAAPTGAIALNAASSRNAGNAPLSAPATATAATTATSSASTVTDPAMTPQTSEVAISGPQQTTTASVPVEPPVIATHPAKATSAVAAGTPSADAVVPTTPQWVQQDMQASSVLPDASTVSGYAGTVMRGDTTSAPRSMISSQMHYPSTPLADDQYALVVAGITSPDQLTQLTKDLQTLSAVTNVQMIGLAGSEVEYHMVMKGTRTELEKELSASGAMKMDAGNAAEGKVLKYQWGS